MWRISHDNSKIPRAVWFNQKSKKVDKMISLCKVANVKDFEAPEFKELFEKNDLGYISMFPNAVPSIMNRKTWEIGMALISLDKTNAIDENSEVLGIGVAKEQTISVLSNKAKRVFATDIYLEPGTWHEWYENDLLVNPKKYMDSNYNNRRVVWQHVDGRDLPYEDNSFDAIFSCSSLEHFGDADEVRRSIEEACRVLKPGGIAAISTEYKISGEGEFFHNVQLFDEERINKMWLEGIPWKLYEPIDFDLDDTEYIDFERSIHDKQYRDTAHPHIKLDNGNFKWTSVHLTFIKNK